MIADQIKVYGIKVASWSGVAFCHTINTWRRPTIEFADYLQALLNGRRQHERR